MAYVMEAKENYAPTQAALVNQGPGGGADNILITTDPGVPGTSFDFNRRKIMYVAFYNTSSNASPVNPSPYTLWDGITLATPGNGALSPYIAEKDIDTGAVVFYNTYTAASIVPTNVNTLVIAPVLQGSGYTHATVTLSGGGGHGAIVTPIISAGKIIGYWVSNPGIGYTSPPGVSVSGDGVGATATATVTVSDGTWRRCGSDFQYQWGNSPVLVNPRNSDVFVRAESCEFYQYRYSDSFAQVISPYFAAQTNFPGSASSANVVPSGIDSTWVYAIELNSITVATQNITLLPAAIAADEVTYDRKLAYAIYTGVTPVTASGTRMTFGSDGDLYFFSLTYTGSAYTYALTKFAPPAFASYGSVTGGTFTDITPWGPATGPNSDGASYTGNSPMVPSYHAQISFMRLPTSNQAVGINKLLKEWKSSTNYNDTKFGCTIMQLGASPGFHYYSGFVTGLMDATWAPTSSLASAAYAVINYREVNDYLDTSDYVYAGVDYSKRWLIFDAYPVSGGVVGSNLMTVLAQYQFVYGSAPTLLQFTDETGWDTAYASYGTAISNSHVLNASLIVNDPANPLMDPGSDVAGNIAIYGDCCLYDDTSQAFWANGISVSWFTTFDYQQPMFSLDSYFTIRATINLLRNYPVVPPFLKFSFGVTPPVSSQRTFGYIF